MRNSLVVLERTYYRTLYDLAGSEIKASKRLLPYKLEEATAHLLRPASRFVISGISGSGKTTITNFLKKRGYVKLRNITTRPKRPGEKEDEYIFITTPTFKRWLVANKIFHPHKRNGVLHGILKTDRAKFLLGKSKFYADKSVAGARNLISKPSIAERTCLIYILPPSFRELYKRISIREQERESNNEKTLSKLEILDRFEEEIADMRLARKMPYAFLVNDNRSRVKKAIAQIAAAPPPRT